MIKQLIKSITIAVFLFMSSSVLAQTGPKDVLEASIDNLLTEFNAHRSELETDKAKLYAFAERIIDKNWDFDKMSQLVLGKSWRRVDEDQKKRFTAAFRGLLLRTYSSVMFKYTGKESIQFKAPVFKGKSNKRATVAASGNLGDGSSIPLSFSMFLNGDEQWRIYNVAVSGVSLVTTYRTSYNQIIASKGIDYLINSINAKAG